MGVVQLSRVPVSVDQLLKLFHCFKQASAELQSLLLLFIVIGHKCNELARSAIEIEVRPLEEQLFGDDQAQEFADAHAPWSRLWPLDKGIHSRASSHKPMRCAKPRTHAQRGTRKLSPSSSTKKRLYRHVLPASTSPRASSRQQ